MPRYDDRYGNTTRLYVGHLSSRTRSRDLEHIFSRYGRVRNVDMKQDFAFVDYSDPRDADDAKYGLNGKEIDGRHITVEHARGLPRGPGGVREYIGRGPAPGSGRCFNCGIDGHWARDCRSGDWKNKCYRCGDRGHIEKNCKNSPKKLRRDRSYSRSPLRSRSPRRIRGRSRSYSQSRSYSRSRSPARRELVERDRSRSPARREPVERGRSRSPVRREPVERAVKRRRSPSYSRSPKQQKGGSSKSRKRSLTPPDIVSPSPERERIVKEQDEESPSPGRRSQSPAVEERTVLQAGNRYDDFEANGMSPSPRVDRSPAVDDAEEERSPRGSETP